MILGGVATTVVWKDVLWCCGGAESLPTTYGTKYWHWLVWKVGAQATRVDIPPHMRTQLSIPNSLTDHSYSG